MSNRNTVYSLFYLLVLISVGLISCGDDGEIVTPVDPIEPPVFDIDIAEVRINTMGNTIQDEPKVMATMTVADYDIDSTLYTDYDGFIGIELRGSTSQTLFDKKSYGIETWDSDGNDIDASIFGFPEEEDWILYGAYSDKSLVRNVLIFEISNEIGRYASRTKICDLYINDDFEGTYVFMEKLKRDKNRIDISKLNPDEISGEDLTGGYILKLDKSTGNGVSENTYTTFNSFPSAYDVNGEQTFSTKTYFQYEYPKAEEIVEPQREYIQSFISDFEDALASDNYMDPDEGYTSYIDVESFIDFFILNEFAHNPDAYRLSTFLYKDKNDKLHIGPIWDFNIAFGNSNFCGGGEPDSWVYRYNETCPFDNWLVPFWWERLLSDPDFSDKVKTRYRELRMTTLSLSNINAKIDFHTDYLSETGSSYRNFNKWQVLGESLWPNRFVGLTYKEEVDYLKDWIRERVNWIDANIDDL